MNKQSFLFAVIETIEKHPEWAKDTIEATTLGVGKFASEAQEKLNRAEMFFKCLDKKSQKRLENMGVKFNP